MKKTACLFLVLIFQSASCLFAGQADLQPVKIGIVGLSHSHVHQILRRPDLGDIKIVGIAESNRDLSRRYAERYGFSMNIVYDTIEEMLKATKPDAVTAFNPINEHILAVRACAPRGIHVMVEKPLAASLKQAMEMEQLAKESGIHLLTNYETTWYATNHRAYEMIHKESAIGKIRKIVVHDGHQGPKEIGVNDEFFEWLTDPVKNGGGAVIDFGCYGANLVTWLMKGQKPLAVSAILQTNKPNIYPRVDDESTILMQYPGAQGIIQGSWNWPFARKDMEVYGQTGYVFADNGLDMRIRLKGDKEEQPSTLDKRPEPMDSPFTWFAAVIKCQVKLQPYGLSTLENNMIVMQILDAAIRSNAEGKTVQLTGVD
jgi:scyllo-inositol 2-dehydrogenase (NADP+)